LADKEFYLITNATFPKQSSSYKKTYHTMKKLLLSFSLILTLTALCLEPVLSAYPIVIGVSKFGKEDREVKNFNGIIAGGPITVIVTLGNAEGLRFEGDADAISTLITEVVKNKLVIRPENSWTSWARKYQDKKIIAYVSAKTIKSIAMSGDGSITVKGTLTGNALAVALSGSGFVTANVDVDSFAGVISGSGNLNISGKADDASVTISGSGNLKKGLAVSSLESVISGSGAININASDSINAVISGSGSINYSGSATVTKRVVGSGKVHKI
jgi:hypothetical protein